MERSEMREQPGKLHRRSRISLRSIRATGLHRKPPNRLKSSINIGLRMIRADLESDLLVALGHDRIVESGGENALVAQMRDHRGGARGIAQQQWHHRMLAR